MGLKSVTGQSECGSSAWLTALITFTDTLLARPSRDFLYPFSSFPSFFSSLSRFSDFFLMRSEVCQDEDFLLAKTVSRLASEAVIAARSQRTAR